MLLAFSAGLKGLLHPVVNNPGSQVAEKCSGGESLKGHGPSARLEAAPFQSTARALGTLSASCSNRAKNCARLDGFTVC
jgi:hypothetical protein